MTIDPISQHFEEAIRRAESQARDPLLEDCVQQFLAKSHELKYSYNFSWLTRPIIQYPQDIIAFQEIVMEVKPDLIIETGIAHGGSLILSASLLCLLDVMEGLDPKKSPRKVVGIDIDIRKHNREAIDNHPLRYKIDLIEGSSIDPIIINQVKGIAKKYSNVIVSLDSNHTHDHVVKELDAYADLVSTNSYCVVFDTIIERLPKELSMDRPWEKGNNPMTAVEEWLGNHPEFKIDCNIDNKLLISMAPKGFLKKID